MQCSIFHASYGQIKARHFDNVMILRHEITKNVNAENIRMI